MTDALTIATGGMNAAAQRLDAVAGRVATFGTETVPDASRGTLPPAATVELSTTALDLIEAKASFSLNAAVARTADRMTQRTLDILA
ncbi:flagellar protein [Methylobacterium sp. NFXW15]|uniref:flagellar protein n=1 Tax=Methylobacterium sp. NFXW15 TaxID=2819512 RepID=UPI003CF125E2